MKIINKKSTTKISRVGRTFTEKWENKTRSALSESRCGVAFCWRTVSQFARLVSYQHRYLCVVFVLKDRY